MKNLALAGVELEQWEIDLLKQKFPAGKFSTKHLEQVGDLGDPEALIVFIYSPITAEALKKFPNLKMVATMSTGFDHIDVAACQQRGIIVSNVPSYGENTVAEQAFALLLALTRKIVPSVERTKHGDFRLEGLRGVDLAGKTFGVIGTGKIGQHAIRMASGFGMKVIAYDPHPRPELTQQLNFAYHDLDQILSESDAVSLHAPATPATHHLLNQERLTLMKPTAFLINTARGSLIDTQALLRVLDAGHLAGVGLDVLEEECAIQEERELLSGVFQTKCDLQTVLADHMLLNHPRVIITPHNAFNTGEALRRILDTTIANVEAFAAGKPINLVK